MSVLIPYAAIGLLTVLIVLREDAKEDAVDCFGDWPAVPDELRAKKIPSAETFERGGSGAAGSRGDFTQLGTPHQRPLGTGL